MIPSKGNSGRVVDADWHQFREHARNEAFSPIEFSDKERERFNLNSDDPLYPANIDGSETDETYTGDDTGVGPVVERRDLRNLPGRG